MKPWIRALAILFMLLCVLLVIFLAKEYFASLLSQFGDASSELSWSIPTPAILLFGGAVLLAFLLASLILLRSFAKIKRKEAESNEDDEDGGEF